jgi:uncharacterized protein
MQTDKTHVLLTGATSGIGQELGYLFAEHGHPLVLVGRRAETLHEARLAFLAHGAPEVHTIVADLAKPGGVEAVRAGTDALGNVEIGILVNDAGRGVHGPFLGTDVRDDLEVVQLNVIALTHLTKLYAQDMVRRGRGRILQVASISSYQPTPLLAVYAATKAFVLSFSDALNDELKDTGVTVTALIPGPTDTDFFRKAGMEHTRAAQGPQDAAAVARIAFERLFQGERHAVAPGMTAQILLSSLLPNDRVAAMAHKEMLPEV